MKTNLPLFLLSLSLAAVGSIHAQSVQIIGDNYNVTGNGSGFGLNAGINSGINPPTTRLTGAAAAGLRYINTGTKATTAYTITSNKLRVTSAADPGRFVLSADGTTPFDFGPALGVAAASPANPIVYDITISMDNDSASNQRFSFALGTTEGDAFSWDFGFQVYRTNSVNNFYYIGKRIDTASSGLASDLNESIYATGANTYGTEITILMRVTDAGTETTGFHSRVQLSSNGGSTWFYDTATDPDLAGTGWRLDGSARVFVWDIAPGAGNVTYDNFSVNWVSGPRTWTGAGANGNWSTGANWGSVPPVNGSTLTFNGTTRQSNTNDISALTVPWLKFNNSGFALYGNALTINSAITNVTGSSALNNAITLGGAVKVQSDAGTLTLGGSVTGGAQNLTVDGAGNTTASGAISGTGSLTKNGTGTLQLSGASANTLSGNTVVNAGTLSLAKSAGVNAVAGNITIGDGTGTDTVQLGAADQISDASVVTVSGGGVLNLNNFNETIGSVSSASATSQISLGSGTLTVGDASSPTFAGTIAGTGSVIKQGAGTLTLSGGNSFSGGVGLNAGALTLANDTALGSGTLTINGGTLSASGTRTIGNAVTVGNNFTVGGAAALTLNGNADLGGATRTITVNNTAATTVAGVVSGTGGLTKDGSGTLQLTGSSANTYSGGTLINGGILTLGKTAGFNGIPGNVTIGDGVGTDELQLNADNQIPDTAAITLAAGGLFDLNGFSETVGSVASSSGTSQITLGAGTLTLGDANSTTYAGSVAGTGNVVKQGTGKLTLSGASTYTGATTINAGVVNAQSATALGTSGTTTVSSGAALEVQGGIAVASQPLTVSGTGISAGGSLRNISGNNSWSGAVTLGADSRINSDSGTLTLSGGITGSGKNLTVGGAGNTTITGVIGTGAGTLTTDGTGTLTLSGANTYTGNTTISGGTLTLGVGGSIASSPTITIANGTTLNVSATSFALGATQTLARNATSGSGTVNGTLGLDLGAKLSFAADGASDTVGSLNVTGGITLHSNTVTVNVTGGTLSAGAYSLVTYTGTRSGSVNLKPTISGSGLAAGMVAKIVQTPGVIALHVFKAETNSVFRVMTYNIHSATGPDGQVNTTRISNYILAQDVDLVALNEVARFMPRSDGRDLIGELAQQTGMTYVFSNNDTSLTGNDQFGNAILSKFPVLFRDHRLLPKVGSNEQRGWLKAIVDMNGKYLSFWVTHLDFHADNTERLKCGTNFNTWLGDETLPVVFCGDFNDTPNTPIYDLLDPNWLDIWPSAGDGSLGRTVPCPGPPFTARIDYIWKARGSNLTQTNAFVGYTIEGSDHYPVLTDFILNTTTNHSAGFFFPFDEGSGQAVTDAIGGLSGSFSSGSASWSANTPSGQSGDDSLVFNGARKITIQDPKQIIGTNGFNDDYTLQAWVKIAVNYAPTERAVLFQYERRPGFSFSINTNRTLHTTAFKQKDVVSTATIPNDGQWHHVAVVHTDGANMKFYIDGTLSATVTYTNGAGYRTASTLTIGAASEGANWFTGSLDRVRFVNQALTPAELDYLAVPQPRVAVDPAFEAWKAAYGITDASADADGDGQSNFAEFTAGTNPTNAASVFKILGGERDTDGGFVLTWASVGGKRYRVQYTDDISQGFTDIERDAASETDSNPAGTASKQSFTDTSSPAHGTRSYRIVVVP